MIELEEEDCWNQLSESIEPSKVRRGRFKTVRSMEDHEPEPVGSDGTKRQRQHERRIEPAEDDDDDADDTASFDFFFSRQRRHAMMGSSIFHSIFSIHVGWRAIVSVIAFVFDVRCPPDAAGDGDAAGGVGVDVGID